MKIVRLLSKKTSPPDPFSLFEEWFELALRSGLHYPNAMTLATASKKGKPSARIVLLKEITRRGIHFYTNYGSRKGKELNENPQASLSFFWPQLDFQVRIEGRVRKLSGRESDAYFATRPRESQIGAHASLQSRPIGDQAELVRQYEKFAKRFEGKPVPRPKNWGGFVLRPGEFEFWIGRNWRLHERLVYRRDRSAAAGWVRSLLSP